MDVKIKVGKIYRDQYIHKISDKSWIAYLLRFRWSWKIKMETILLGVFDVWLPLVSICVTLWVTALSLQWNSLTKRHNALDHGDECYRKVSARFGEYLYETLFSLIQGELMSATHPNESSLIPQVIPGNQTCSKMICFYLTDYVLNTAGQVYYEGNFFNRTVNASQV